MTTETLDIPTETPTHGDLEIGHIAWVDNLQLALCGKKLEGIVLDHVTEVCVVCAELEDRIRAELYRGLES